MVCLLGIAGARQDFVVALCQFAVPDGFSLAVDSHARPVQVSDKNLDCAHSLVNMAKYVGQRLGPGWRPILGAIQQVRVVLFCVCKP
jgi:hypothetical protein